MRTRFFEKGQAHREDRLGVPIIAYPLLVGLFLHTASIGFALGARDPAFTTQLYTGNIEQYFEDPRVQQWVSTAIYGNQEDFEAALVSGFDVNARGNRGATPLFFAVKHDSHAGVSRLLVAGADPNITLDNGISILGVAIGAPTVDIARLLLQAGANPNQTSGAAIAVFRTVSGSFEESAIPGDPLIFKLAGWIGRSAGRGAFLHEFIRHGAELNVVDQNGFTPMMVAMHSGNFDYAKQLFEAGACVPMQTRDGEDISTFVERILDDFPDSKMIRSARKVEQSIKSGSFVECPSNLYK